MPNMVAQMFQMSLMEQKLNDRVGISTAGCLSVCLPGATVVVYPDVVWYSGVDDDDVAEIVEEHLVGGNPVARLLFDPKSLLADPFA